MKIKEQLGNEIFDMVEARTETQGLVLNGEFLSDTMFKATKSNNAMIIVAAFMNPGLAGKLLGKDKFELWKEMISNVVQEFNRYERETNLTNRHLSSIIARSTDKILNEFGGEDEIEEGGEEEEEEAQF